MRSNISDQLALKEYTGPFRLWVASNNLFTLCTKYLIKYK